MYTEKEKNRDFLLVCLYVDDLIFTGNNARMIHEFKDSLIREFEMTDIRLMSHYLGIKVKQEERGIFISQEAYAKSILKKFNIEESNAVSTPIDCRIKLSRYYEGSNVDPLISKSWWEVIAIRLAQDRIFSMELGWLVIIWRSQNLLI